MSELVDEVLQEGPDGADEDDLPEASGTQWARRLYPAPETTKPQVRNSSLTWGFLPERVTRIELALSAWEADVLPLNYTRALPVNQQTEGSYLVTRTVCTGGYRAFSTKGTPRTGQAGHLLAD
jgi:hypothetical protein